MTAKFQGSAVTIGNFDGVHLGHRALLSQLVAEARKMGIPSVAVSFEPHPLKVLHPEYGFEELFPPEDLLEQAAELGVSAVVLHPFTQELSQLSSEDFLQKLFLPHLRPKFVLLGPDFRFGRDRGGEKSTFDAFADSWGFQTAQAEMFLLDDHKVSSTRIRRAILDGNVESASDLLGRPYELRGVVVAGAGRGKPMGIPTANLQNSEGVLPAAGVYISNLVLNGEIFPAVTNVGLKPTFGQAPAPTVETHVLNFGQDLYGKNIRVRFLKRLRGEHKFRGVDELKKQIELDIQQAKQHFKLP